MHRLNHERTIERPRESASRGKSVWGGGIRRIAGVPDEVDVVPDLWDPVKAKIEVDTAVLVVQLHEVEKAGARIDRVLEPRGNLRRDEMSRRKIGFGAREVDAADEVSPAPPRPAHRCIDAPAGIEAAPADH